MICRSFLVLAGLLASVPALLLRRRRLNRCGTARRADRPRARRVVGASSPLARSGHSRCAPRAALAVWATALALTGSLLTAPPAAADPPAPVPPPQPRSLPTAEVGPGPDPFEVTAADPAAVSGSLTTADDTATSDVVGPSRNTIARADQLSIVGGQANFTGQRSYEWMRPNADLTEDVAHGQPASPARALMRQQFPTASGRFLDGQKDGVLALQRMRVGAGSLWQLGSVHDQAEPRDAQKLVTEVPAGQAVGLTTDDDAALYSPQVDSLGVQAQLRTSSRQPALDADQLWTPVYVADEGGLRVYQIVNRADGLCLDVLGGSKSAGAPVGTYPCSGVANQQFIFQKVSDGTSTGFIIVSNDTSLALERDAGGHLVQANRTDAAEQRWYLRTSSSASNAVPTWSVAGDGDAATPADLAVGDLDQVVTGPDKTYHDEAVVAYADGDHRLQVRVIDYNGRTETPLTVTSPDKPLPTIGSSVDGRWYPGSVGVAIGNFTGGLRKGPDGTPSGELDNEIAVTWQDAHDFHAAILEYDAADQGKRSLRLTTPDLKLFGADPLHVLSMVSGFADTVAGDFDGRGRDSLAIAYAVKEPQTDPLPVPGHAWDFRPLVGIAGFQTASGTAAELATQQVHRLNGVIDGGQTATPAMWSVADTATWTQHGPHLVAGLFKVDSTHGFDLQRRQLAVAWTQQNAPVGDVVQMLQVAPAQSACDRPCGLDVADLTKPRLITRPPAGWVDALPPISLTAGAFAGLGKPDEQPVWSVALASADDDHSYIRLMDADRLSGADKDPVVVRSADPKTQWVLTGYDREGKSLKLGAPGIITLTALNRAEDIAAQPPGHLDWLDGGFEEVSRTNKFNVEFGSSGTEKFQSEDSSTYSTGWGFSADTTVSASTKNDILVGSAEANASLEWKTSNHGEAEDKTLSSFGRSQTLDMKDKTGDDDVVNGKVRTISVYRYPILGGPVTKADGTSPSSDCSPCHGYYDIQVPGSILYVHGSGKLLDWYQPSWENGNALSYPKAVNGEVPIDDQGQVTYKDATGHDKVKSDPYFNTSFDVAAKTGANNLTVGTELGTENEHSSSGTITDEETLKAGVKVRFGSKDNNATGSVDLTMQTDQTRSLGSLTSSKSKTSTAKSFKLNIPQIKTEDGYTVAAAYYTDKNGVDKVVHAVDFSKARNGGFWQQNYGIKPDPALNLPLGIELLDNGSGEEDVDEPKWNSYATRQLIRGFSVLDGPTEASLGLKPMAKAGADVKFRLPVHNYSLVDATNVPIRFYAVPVDKTFTTVGDATQIGQETVIPLIKAQDSVTVTSPAWSAINSTKDLQNYRIFVQLNHDGQVDEIHPLHSTTGAPCPSTSIDGGDKPGKEHLIDPMSGKVEDLDCGQNDQGYGELTVAPQTDLQASRAKPRLSVLGITLSTDDSSPVAAPSRRQSVVQGENLVGHVHVATDVHSLQSQPVLVFDGPVSKGRLIASTTLAGVSATGGGTATFQWRPTRTGRHRLNAVVLPGPTGGKRVTGRLLVNVKPVRRVTRLAITPERAARTSGAGQSFHATAFGKAGHKIGDVTSRTTFSVAGGTCTANVCRAATQGVHRVTGRLVTAGRTVTGTAVLTVACPTISDLPQLIRGLGAEPAIQQPLLHVAAAAARATAAGDMSTARRRLGTLAAQIRNGVGKSYASSMAEPVIKAVESIAAGTCRAEPERAARIRLSPATSTVKPHQTQPYTAIAWDKRGRLLGEVTGGTRLRISRHGTCDRQGCRSAVLGRHHVHASYGKARATASLTVRR